MSSVHPLFFAGQIGEVAKEDKPRVLIESFADQLSLIHLANVVMTADLPPLEPSLPCILLEQEKERSQSGASRR